MLPVAAMPEPPIAADMADRADADLLTAWVGGEETAFAALIARHGGLVRAACVRQAPRNDIDDCVQAVFLVLSRRPTAAAACPSLAAWLLRVASHVCRRARRSAVRRIRAETHATPPAPPPSEARPDDAIRHLDDCLLHLPERQRMAVVMRYLSGRSPEDIASSLGVTRNNAYQLLNRGLGRLRDLFERRGVAIEATCLLALLGAASDAAAAEAAAAGPPAMAAVAAPTTQASTLATASWWWTGAVTVAAASLLAAGVAVAAAGRAPDAPAAMAPAHAVDRDGPGWRPLLGARDLDGWEVHRGSWTNVDGVLSATTTADNGARIRTTASYGDLELRCRMRVAGTAELQLGDYSAFFSVLSTGGRWVEVRLSRHGASATCSADGLTLPLESEMDDPTLRDGPIAIHGHFGSVEVADLRILTSAAGPDDF